MRTSIYLHNSKDSNWEKGTELGLSGDALKRFVYACLEVELEVEVDPQTGGAEIISVDGRELKEPKR